MTSLLIKNALVFDGEADALAGERDILVRDGRIEAIEARIGGGADRVLEAAGRVAMPGLIDAHFHANAPLTDVAAADRMAPALLAQYARANLEGALLRGFTTVRDAGGADVGLAQAVERGLIGGPRLFFGGRALSQTGGHGDLRDPHDVHACGCALLGSLTQVVDGVEAVRRTAREELRHGASHIKLMMSGGVLSDSDPIWMAQFADEEVAAAVIEAERWRAYVMAHAHTAEAALRCARLGVRSVEHGTLIDAPTARRLADSPIYVVPTLTIIDSLLRGDAVALPERSRDKLAAIAPHALAAVEACAQAGVRLGLGTDLLGELHPRQARELVLRAQVQSPLDVLKSATSVNAALIGRPGELGVLKAGALADILLVEGDPIRDIGLLAEPQTGLAAIISRGRLVREALGR
ncbi:MAG: amidohydrolase family protein [Caulobacteraceae bacterium]|nr:amidohydrolase family protein [Caulobacteraceae bacterium]